MTLRVLVPLDKLEPGHPALHFARLNFPDAHLFLLHVLPPLEVQPHLEEGAVERVRDVLHGLGRGEVVLADDPAEVILEQASTGAFDVIVMGTQRKGRLERFFLGSVAERVVRESQLPVITVPMSAAARVGKAHHITVLTDFSAAAERAFQSVKALWPAAQVDPVHIFSPGSVTSPFALDLEPGGSLPELYAERNREWLDEARAHLDALGGGQIVEGHAPHRALEQARVEHLDLVAMGTASRPGLGSWLFGSLAQKVVRESPVPVLTVHAPSATSSGGVS